MNADRGKSVLEQVRAKLEKIAEEEGLFDTSVTVLAKPLTPQEAIGTPGRRDFPIIVGNERILEAGLLGANGTFDDIWGRIQAEKKTGILYGVTASGTCALTGIERLCPCGRQE